MTAYDWAADRASACGRPLQPRLDACGTRGLAVRCGCGPRTYWRGCGQWQVCARCRAARFRPLAQRLVESVEARTVEAQAGGRRVRWRFVTFTVRTSGNVDDDRKTLGDSFRRFYQSSHKWLGRRPYVLHYEVTPGATERGHVHAHAMLLWPAWVDYGRVRTLWIRAAQGASTRIDIRTVDGDGRGAVRYLAKYMTKGSDGLPPALAGEVIAAFYLRRWMSASRRFWQPVCGCRRCGQPIVLDGASALLRGDAATPWEPPASALIAITVDTS